MNNRVAPWVNNDPFSLQSGEEETAIKKKKKNCPLTHLARDNMGANSMRIGTGSDSLDYPGYNFCTNPGPNLFYFCFKWAWPYSSY